MRCCHVKHNINIIKQLWSHFGRKNCLSWQYLSSSKVDAVDNQSLIALRTVGDDGSGTYPISQGPHATLHFGNRILVGTMSFVVPNVT